MVLETDYSNRQFNSVNDIRKNTSNNNYEKGSPLQEFYRDQFIFITGGTGFLGKILIEKLLRCCPNISGIYILIRPKKGKNVIDRIQEFIQDPVFQHIRNNMPSYMEKIIGIPGDCNLSGLGLSINDQNLLINNVTIVFHVAATVRFDENLKQAANLNTQGIARTIDLFKNIKNLKCLMHVSTTYSNCFTSYINEQFYDYSLKYDQFLAITNSLPRDIVNNLTTHLVSSWPNTYTFTKAMAEDLIRKEYNHLPIGIFRPGIVLAAANEPTAGWIDTYNGPTGVVMAVASGIMRTMHCDPKVVTNLVPADLTINALIASAWDVAVQTNRRNEDMLIYNFTSTVEAPISWGTFTSTCVKYIHKYPSKNTFWYSFMEPKKNKYSFYICDLIYHWTPALVLDWIAYLTGQKPKLVKLYHKMHKLLSLVNYFCINEWRFDNKNVQCLWSRLDPHDQQIFPFTMKNFNWDKYIEDYVKGIRVYLLKDDLNSLKIISNTPFTEINYILYNNVAVPEDNTKDFAVTTINQFLICTITSKKPLPIL